MEVVMRLIVILIIMLISFSAAAQEYQTHFPPEEFKARYNTGRCRSRQAREAHVGGFILLVFNVESGKTDRSTAYVGRGR